MECTSERYKNTCRCCLEGFHANVTRKLTKTVEKRFFELTSTQLTTSPKLSSKVCINCYELLEEISAKRKILIQNQELLENLLLQEDPIAKCLIKEEFNFVEIESIVIEEPIPPTSDESLSADDTIQSASTSTTSQDGFMASFKSKRDDSDYEKSAPLLKKKKKAEHELKIKTSRLIVTEKVVQEINKLLSLAEFDERIDESHLIASYPEGKERMSVTVKCLLCKPHKDIRLSTTKYSADTGNFSRHMTSVHTTEGRKMNKRATFSENEYREVKYRQTRNCPEREDRRSSRLLFCDNCDFKTHTRTELQAHILTHLPDDDPRVCFMCDYEGCNKVYRVATSLKNHEKLVHLQANLLECHLCPKTFDNETLRQQHILYVHKTWFIKCGSSSGSRNSVEGEGNT